MQTGTIQKLINYYLSAEKFRPEIERARKEFFDIKEGDVLLAVNEKYEPFFLEWLVFDFRLKNNKSLLEDYYFLNLKKLPLYEMQIYKDLQKNIYGLLEVRHIDLDEGMEVLVLHTGEKYYVYERSATLQLKKGNLMFNRVAKVGDHYELVGADSFMFDIRMNTKTKKHFIDKNLKYSPKDAMKYLESRNNDKEEVVNFDLAETKSEINDLFGEMGIARMVNADLILKWLAEIEFKRKAAATSIIDILFCLTDAPPLSQQTDRLIGLIILLANHSPQKALKGRSPSELYKSAKTGSKGYDFSITRLGGEWIDHADKAIVLLKDKNIPKALDEYEKTFKFLLKEKTTARYIFNHYANLAICNLALGDEYAARQLLEIAIKLNSNYKFAVDLLAKLDRRENMDQLAIPIRFALEYTQTKELKKFWKKARVLNDAELCRAYYDISLEDHQAEWEDNPAKKYYDFIKQFKINFKTDV